MDLRQGTTECVKFCNLLSDEVELLQLRHHYLERFVLFHETIATDEFDDGTRVGHHCLDVVGDLYGLFLVSCRDEHSRQEIGASGVVAALR
jgi:hypothetical protein